MAIDLSALLAPEVTRVLVTASLQPLLGTRFQPTGFPDLGPALYESAQGQSLLVESAQSTANRLEATLWDPATLDLIPEAKGLSYVRVTKPGGGYLTSSITEAHRLNSPYILEGKDSKVFAELKQECAPSSEAPASPPSWPSTISTLSSTDSSSRRASSPVAASASSVRSRASSKPRA